MAKTYTWEDFERAYNASPFRDQFSQADLNLARQNPDAGMSLLSFKTDYANATTDEARALANQGAESIRSSYGGYTGGGDGGSFKLNPMSPNQFSYGDAPTFEDKWEGRISDALEASMNRDPYSYGGGPAPEYTSRYDPQIQETLAGILGRGEFSYDPKTDPVYAAYQKQYAREGQRATANAMGEAAAMTGGMPSSWAMTAASQAGDYYGAQMADKIPELYQDAYNRYLQEYQMKLSDLSALRGLESDDYSKYRDQLSQYNTDRQFDYATWLDQQQLSQQDIDNLRALRSDDLDLYKTNLGQYNTNRQFDYGQWLDEISNQRTAREDQRAWAQNAAAVGDYSLLDALGINTDTAQRRDAIFEAIQAAEIGDYSALAALGFDVTNAQQLQALEQAYKQAQISNIYASMPTEEERALDLAYRRAQIDNIYSGMPTEEERALEAEYKRAQIQKALSGGSSGSGSGTDGLTNSQLLTLAAAQAKRGDYSLYDELMEQYGLSTDYDAVDEASAAGMKIKTADDLDDLFAYIRERKAAGDPEVQSAAAVSRLITGLDGYNAKKMQDKLDAFISELFSKANRTKTKAVTQAITVN